ncbi:Uu.00g091150.m01.CDS01 [Anthostomella pinea]|uniref:Formate dehydrogenase n=1 Tax=Anthostomella pinea TaxID=933095 RepID=A0AAI8VN03_9PEZI|nr:Uu.00g091150.m01.CDS01 [Anthostomella pinea]
MVFLTRSLPRCARYTSSRALSTTAAARSVITNARPAAASLRAGLTSRAAVAPKSHTSPLFSSPSLRAPASTRLLTTQREKVKVLLVLYDGGKHAEEVPELLGTTENELGIRKWLEDQGHTLVTTSDKEGENSTFDKELVDAEVIITTPFHPGYLTAERLAKAKKLKIAITAGIGSDHVDLDAANKTNGGITVAEVTGSNVVSVAEHVIMTILVLVRNFVPAHEQIQEGDWNVAAAAKNEYDLENKVVGTVAVGRIGERVLRRLKAFDCKELLYFDYQPLKPEVEKEIGCRRVDSLEEMLGQCDVVTINCPLHEKTRGLFNKELISKMKPGSWLVNTARGAIVVKEDVAEALKSGHLRGYGGDVWFPQPAPKDHVLRYAKNPFGGGNAMVPHMSGTSIDAQKRYADGTKAILNSYFTGKHDYRPEDLIVKDGDYVTKAYGQRNKKA